VNPISIYNSLKFGENFANIPVFAVNILPTLGVKAPAIDRVIGVWFAMGVDLLTCVRSLGRAFEC